MRGGYVNARGDMITPTDVPLTEHEETSAERTKRARDGVVITRAFIALLRWFAR